MKLVFVSFIRLCVYVYNTAQELFVGNGQPQDGCESYFSGPAFHIDTAEQHGVLSYLSKV